MELNIVSVPFWYTVFGLPNYMHHICHKKQMMNYCKTILKIARSKSGMILFDPFVFCWGPIDLFSGTKTKFFSYLCIVLMTDEEKRSLSSHYFVVVNFLCNGSMDSCNIYPSYREHEMYKYDKACILLRTSTHLW